MGKIMVHLFHPCIEIDVIELDDGEDERTLYGQGYINLEDLRNLQIKVENMEVVNITLDKECNYWKHLYEKEEEGK